MILKIFWILFCILSINLKGEGKPNSSTTQYCLVKSYKFKDEYLFSSNKINKENYRKIHVNKPTMKIISNFDQLKWIFEPVNGLNNSFYIKNANYKNENLCAKDTRNDFLKSKRPVHLININQQQESLTTTIKCIWRLEAIDKNGKFVITNSYFNEPLFPSSSFIANRKLYTWNYLKTRISYLIGPDLDQFIWYIYCSSVSNFKWEYTKKY
jgi:hypothetical protein